MTETASASLQWSKIVVSICSVVQHVEYFSPHGLISSASAKEKTVIVITQRRFLNLTDVYCDKECNC